MWTLEAVVMAQLVRFLPPLWGPGLSSQAPGLTYPQAIWGVNQCMSALACSFSFSLGLLLCLSVSEIK